MKSKIFNKLRLLTYLLCLWAASTSASWSFDLIDKTIAVVEDNLILESDLQRRIAHVRFQNPNINGTVSEELQAQILQQLVDEELQLILAKRGGVRVPEEEITAALSNFKKQLQQRGTNFESYLQALAVEEAQVREQIEKDLKIQRVQQGSLNQRIRITDREIDEFLESKEGQEWLKTRYNLGHILLPINGDNEEAASTLAQQLYRQLSNNTIDFQEAAARYSGGPNSSQGGSLGWRAEDQLPALFVNQADQLEPNQISQPFRSNAGFHILKLYERNGAEAVLVERYKVRHILIKTSELFTEEEAKDKINQLYQAALNGEDFIALAKEHTDDTASKFGGGDLGWSLPGKFVPEFERIMTTTPLNQISEPFRSSFGWHILRVEDRRTENMFETVKRNRAGGLLRSRRIEDELQIWLQELREDAYVNVL